MPKYSPKQLKAIRRSYAKKAQREDRRTIIEALLGIPGLIGVMIVVFGVLFKTTGSGWFIVGIISLIILEIIVIYRAVTRETRRGLKKIC